MRDLREGLGQRAAAHRYRRRRTLTRSGVWCQEDGRRLLAFCGNDYLNLSQHPEVVAAFQRGAQDHGVGSGAAHLIHGHGPAHQALEEALAAFLGQPRALLFSTGYMANLALLSALAGRGDTLFQDRLDHASLVDGAQLSGARLRRYPHGDLTSLARMLAETGAGERLVATDGVFSMDGDLAPLPELAQLCQERDAWLLVDDAHGFGVLGPGGRGTPAHFGLAPGALQAHLVTLGKALGTFGALVAASEEVIETLIQQARPYIYTTAPPPALAAASLTALGLLERADDRRQRLTELVARFRQGAEQLGLPLLPSMTPIQPLLLGSEQRALAWSAGLEGQGILVSAIRPPTVPAGRSRLRITFSAGHELAHVDLLLAALEQLVLREPA